MTGCWVSDLSLLSYRSQPAARINQSNLIPAPPIRLQTDFASLFALQTSKKNGAACQVSGTVLPTCPEKTEDSQTVMRDTTNCSVAYLTDVEGNWDYFCNFIRISEALSFEGETRYFMIGFSFLLFQRAMDRTLPSQR